MESGHLHVLICRSLASGKFRLRVAKAENLRGSKRLIEKRNIQQMNFTF